MNATRWPERAARAPEWERVRFFPWVDVRHFDGHAEYQLGPEWLLLAKGIVLALAIFTAWWLSGVLVWRIE